jgi:transcriptional regulator with XRE-family HTH domain
MDMAQNQPPQVGRNILRERKKKNMSLDELAKKSGVSKSMLSQIEQEKTNPTVITVFKISRALGINMQQLLETSDSVHIEVIRSDDAPMLYSDDKSCIIKINTPLHMADNLELYHIIFKPFGKLVSKPHYPNAEEFLTVISGRLKVTAGNTSVVLNKGDTARYRADVDHKIENIEDDNAESYLTVYFS